MLFTVNQINTSSSNCLLFVVDTKDYLDLVPDEDDLHVDANDPDKDIDENSSDDDDDFV